METNDCLRTVKRHIWLILFLGLLSAASGWTVSKYVVTPKYQSNAMVVVSYSDVTANSSLSATKLPDSNTLRLFFNLAESDKVAERTIGALQLAATTKDMHKLISTEMDYQTGVMSISVETEDAARSKGIIDTYISALGEEMGSLFSGLKIYVVDQPKIATEPSSPNVPLNIVLSAFGGMMVAILISILVGAKEQSQTDVYVLGKLPKLFVMGYFPKLETKKHANFDYPREKKINDTVRMIGANLQYLVDHNGIKTIVVSSPKPQEGKTTVSMYMATAMGLSNKNVLIVDCNLNNSSFYMIETMRSFNTQKNSHHIVGEYVMKNISDMGVDMIMIPHDKSGIKFGQLQTFFEEMEKHYDLVLVDCPSVLANADTMMLLNVVKNVVLIADYRNLSYHVLDKCIHRLTQIGTSILGVVVNRTPQKKMS